jgi:hypothetical protein
MQNIKTVEDIYKLLSDNEETQLSSKFAYISKKTKNKSKLLSLGRIWFNILLEDTDIPLIDEPVTKHKINDIIAQISDSNVLSKLTKESFKLSTLNPISIDINSLIIPTHIEDKKQKLLKSNLTSIEFQNKALSITEEYIKWLKETDSNFYHIIQSKAKLSTSEVMVLLIGKGSTVDIENKLHEPITSSINDGYNIEQYYQSAAETRNALYVRSKGTAEPGAQTRKINFANASLMISDKDCKTKKYLKLTYSNDIFNAIIGRYYVDEKNNLKKITKKTKLPKTKKIKLRSPIYCKSKDNKICNICYGELAEINNTKHIGLNAASAINKLGVEGYAMSMRHKATNVNFGDVDFTKDLINLSGK